MNLPLRIPLAVLCVFAAYCAGKSPTAPSDVIIRGTTWKLRSIQQAGSATLEIPNPDRFTLLFEEDGRVTVRADCNVCTGRYDLTDSAVRLTGLACTRAFCGTDSPDQRFLSALQSTTLLARTDGIFTLEASGTLLVFTE
jgi:heat shock protein HslJ